MRSGACRSQSSSHSWSWPPDADLVGCKASARGRASCLRNPHRLRGSSAASMQWANRSRRICMSIVGPAALSAARWWAFSGERLGLVTSHLCFGLLDERIEEEFGGAFHRRDRAAAGNRLVPREFVMVVERVAQPRPAGRPHAGLRTVDRRRRRATDRYCDASPNRWRRTSSWRFWPR